MGTAESTLGLALRQRATQVRISTKFGIEPPRFGQTLSWVRGPYRWLRRVSGQGQARPSTLRVGMQAQAPIGLLKSLERSLRALRVAHVDTLLTHEFVDDTRLAQQLEALRIARDQGLLTHFGCSGHREAVVRSLEQFSRCVDVVQVSSRDAAFFKSNRELRLFGAVSFLRPLIEQRASANRNYQEGLLSALSDVGSQQERFSLGAISIVRALYPDACLIFNTQSEARIEQVVRCINDNSIANWVSEFRTIHEQMLFENVSV